MSADIYVGLASFPVRRTADSRCSHCHAAATAGGDTNTWCPAEASSAASHPGAAMCTAGSGSDPATVGTSRHASVVLLRGSTSTADCRGPANQQSMSMRCMVHRKHQWNKQRCQAVTNEAFRHHYNLAGTAALTLLHSSQCRVSSPQFPRRQLVRRTSKHEARAIDDGGGQRLLQRAAAGIQGHSIPAQHTTARR